MDIVIEHKGADYLIKAENCTREQLLDAGFSVYGTVTFDATNGIYFRISHPSISDFKVTPFKDTVKHRPPLERW